MDESDLAALRQHCRVTLLERLLIAKVVGDYVLYGGMNPDESLQLLTEWLDTQKAKGGQLFGAHFREPGMTALYAEELKTVTDNMKEIAVKVADALRT